MTLSTALDQLETTDMVRRLPESDLAYLFKHALVQDTTHASLLSHERKRLHRLVGQALEDLYPEQRSELSPLLAQHFGRAGDDVKTFEYASLAAAESARKYAHAEAVAEYTAALAAGLRLDAPVQDLFLKRGRVLELSGNFPAALKNYLEMSETATARGDRELELAAIMAAATIYSIPSPVYDAARGNELNDRALELARALDNNAAEALILWNLMLLNSRVGTGFDIAIRYGEQALEIARANNLYERLAYILNDLSPLLTFHGQAELGRQYNLEARAMWVTLGNLPMLSGNYGYAAMHHLLVGEYEPAITASQECLRISREINNTWNEAFAQSWVGEGYLELGEITLAEEVMCEAIAVGESVFPPTLILTRSDLAWMYTDLGQPARGIELAGQALAVADQRFKPLRAVAVGTLGHAYLKVGQIEPARELLSNVPDIFDPHNNPRYAFYATRAQIELALYDHDYVRAVAVSERLLEFLRQNKIRQHQPLALDRYARALAGSGETVRALETLEHARTLAEEMNTRWSLWQILATMSELETACGNAAAAAQARTEAKALIDYIAARTPPELRATFLEHAL